MIVLKNKPIKEIELFQKVNIHVTERNKKQLERVVEKLSLLTNIEMDNSSFLRGFLEYSAEHPEVLEKISPYMEEAKGYHFLSEFTKMMNDGMSAEEIDGQLGIGVETAKDLLTKNKDVN